MQCTLVDILYAFTELEDIMNHINIVLSTNVPEIV